MTQTSQSFKCPAMAVVWIFFYSNLFSTYCGAPVLNEPLFSGNIIIIPAAGKSPACKYFQMKRQYSALYLVGGDEVPFTIQVWGREFVFFLSIAHPIEQ